MMQFEEVTLNVPWGKLAVVCHGHPGGKAIVMVHGIQDSAGTFFPLINRLKLPNDFQMIILDLPGNGKSDAFPVGRPLHLMDYISPIKMVAEHFKLKRFTFLGHSMGAQIGLMYHAIYPNEIERFVSLDSLSYVPIEAENYADWFKYVFERFYDPKNYGKFNSTRDTGPIYTYEKALESVMKSRNLTEDAGKAALLRCLIPAGDGLYRLSWDQRMKAFGITTFGHQYQVELLGKMCIPHLTVFATQSIESRLATVKTHLMDAHIKNNPGYRLALVEGNHDVHLNSPELVAPYVREFLLGGSGDKELTDRLLKKFYEIYQTKTRQKSKL